MQQTIPGGQAAGAGDAAGAIVDGSDRTFMADVVEASRTTPVIVDFWATWCGPCKQLGPILEKVVREAKGAVRLVKIDVDKNPMIAGQLRVQSIPTVYAFVDGRPVDAFQGALPESQVRAFVEKLAGSAANSPVAEALEQGKAALESGDADTAAAIFAEVLQHEPENAVALAGIARYHIGVGNIEDAKAAIADIPAAAHKDAFVAAAIAALELAEQSGDTGDLQELLKKVEADPDDHQARFDLSMALFGAKRHQEAADHMLEIVRRDRDWNEDAARKQLVKFFEAWGPMHELTRAVRRQLSSIMFS